MDDQARLHAHLTSHRRKLAEAVAMIEHHLDTHGGHVAWSGGKDSTIVAHLAHTVRPGTPIVTYVAGTEYPEVLPYCADLAAKRGWAWETIRTGDILDHLRGGGEIGDDEWWQIMIAGPAAIAHERHGPGLLWGLRGSESPQRAAMLYSTRGVRTRLDGVTTCAPLWRWSSIDVYAALHTANIPLCPVYARLEELGAPEPARRVGRMIGRRGATTGRYVWLRRGWPDEWTRLARVVPWLRDAS